jgi:6-pyruvoyltetrahydropterin/6-carboxytetrahydropterin synthase
MTDPHSRYPHELAVRREFIAQHVLTVPDPDPPEDEVHSHHFTVEVTFAGSQLGEYDYLVDITDVDAILDNLVGRYRDTLLNDLPEFQGHNPSIEHFSRVFGDRVESALTDDTPDALCVTVWEDDTAWASHRRALSR